MTLDEIEDTASKARVSLTEHIIAFAALIKYNEQHRIRRIINEYRPSADMDITHQVTAYKTLKAVDDLIAAK